MSSPSEPRFTKLALARQGDVFILTLSSPPENRLNSAFCREIITAFHHIQRVLGPSSSGAVITTSHSNKFFCTGLELNEGDTNPLANTDGFYPMLHTILDFPYPTVALLTGHTFGGACPFALAHDYRVMNSKRGFISMVCLFLRVQSPKILLSSLPFSTHPHLVKLIYSKAARKSRSSLRWHRRPSSAQACSANCAPNASRSAPMDWRRSLERWNSGCHRVAGDHV